MNKIYSAIWNACRGQVIVASELARQSGQGAAKGTARVGAFSDPRLTRSLSLTTLVAALAAPPHAFAQVSIPAGTALGTYLNTNLSAVNNNFVLAGNATWNTGVAMSAARSTLTLDGAGNTVTVGVPGALQPATAGVTPTTTTFSNLNFVGTAAATLPIFNYATAGVTSNVNLNDTTFSNFTGGGAVAGSIINVNGTATTVANFTAGGPNGVTFSNNSATGDGAGVISVTAGSAVFNGNYNFQNSHTVDYGGAIAMYQAGAVPGSLTFNGTTTFTNDYAALYFGGAIDLWGGYSTLTFNGPTTFTGNYVDSAVTATGGPAGGAINVGYTSPSTGAAVVQTNSSATFNGNYIRASGAGASARGGAVAAFDSGANYNYQLLFNGPTTFSNNYAVKTGTGAGGGYGGAIYFQSAQASALLSLGSGSQFLNNSASTNGGAIYMQSGVVSLGATTDNILFQGNRQGVTVTAGLPVAGTGTPNAIYFAGAGTLNMNAAAGESIAFRDPIGSAVSIVTVNKTGDGEVAFYGDNGASTQYDSNIQANTTVSGGLFTLANGASYGVRVGARNFTVTTGTGTAGTVQGGNGSFLRAGTVSIANGGTVNVTGGTFTIDAVTTTFQSGSRITGQGILASTGNIGIPAGATTVVVAPGEALNITGALVGLPSANLSVQGGGRLTVSNAANAYALQTVAADTTLIGGVANVLRGNLLLTGTLDMAANNLDQSVALLSGSGSVLLGSAALTVNNTTASTFTGTISGTGSLIKAGSSTLELSGANSYTGGSSVQAGTLVLDNDGAAGTGPIAMSAAGATVRLAFGAGGGTLANQITGGTGQLNLQSGNVAAVTAQNSSVGTVVNSGNLSFLQNGAFTSASGISLTSSSSTTFAPDAQLIGLSGQTNLSGTVNVSIGAADHPSIIASTVTLGGTLNVTSFTAPLPLLASGLAATLYPVVRTTNTMGGTWTVTTPSDFSPDYLNLTGAVVGVNAGVRLGLRWTAPVAQRNGVFTLVDPLDTFNVDVALVNQAASGTTGWNGQLLTKNGAGTLVLSGNNTYSGGTTINGGTLQIGNGGTTGSVVGNVLNDATLAFNRSDAVTYAGVVSGSGSVVKQGANTLSLTGENTYTGGTTISAGTLQIGAGGTIGSLAGDIVDNATLAFNRSDAYTYAGAISGSGAVVKLGTGVTSLTGASSYTGGTTVSAGTLQIGDGGATGSITGDVVDNATLAFNRSDTLNYAGAISGAGVINQVGAGNTVLTGNSAAFAGTTNVTAGTLSVNGTLGSAASTMNVSGGGTLGGSGTIGGNVSITNGILAPGNSPGTLTINGNLVLAGSSILNYELGQAGVAGGALNDLTVVNGNLTLDGTLNVTPSAGGAYGPGLYRLFTYGGTLTNNGLLLGSMPADSTNYVQTGLAGQVNLVNTAGLEVNYWDGAGPHFNGVIEGGSGVWQAAAGNDNWTDGTGMVNAGFVNGSFSIFAGAAGTVTVDDSLGAINSAGMQFAVDGYRIEGDAIALAAGSNPIRVGDGSGAGAGYTATIASALTGAGGVDKTDLGTLVLTGANTYTGGTTITDGTLQLGDGTTAGSIVGDVTDNATLAFNNPGTTTFEGVISGTGTVEQLAGTTVLTAANTYTGGTSIATGATLQLGDGTSAGSIVGDVTDNGTLALDNPGSTTLAGVISGTGALAQLGGTTVLTAANTYTGGTTVATGATLQLGDGTTAGSIVGDVTDDGTLAFDNPGTTTFAGAIGGTGAVHQVGGTTLLTASNSYAGGTTVRGGVLSVAADANLGAAAGVLTLDGGTLEASSSFATGRAVSITANGATLQTDAGATLTASGVIGGATGALIKSGAGTLVTTAANTYGGGTTISAGTLQLGDGTTAGSITGDVTDNGTLAFNNPGTTTFAGVISGTGAVDQLSGTTVLTAANTYAGGTSIATGSTLQLGNGTTAGSIVGDVTDDGTLAFDNPGSTTFAGVVSGTGALGHLGGTTVLTAANTYTGGTTISGGTLQLGDGTTAGSIVGDVTDDGTLAFNNPGSTTFAGVISGSGAVNQIGTGTTVLSGTNSYAGGTTVSGGTLSVAADANLGASAGALTLDGGTLEASASFATAREVTIGTGNGTLQTDAGATLTTSGVIAGATGGLTKAGAGTLVTTAANTYGGGTTIGAGTLQLGDGTTAGSIVGDVTDNGTLAFNNPGTTTFAGVISGTGAVEQLGGTTVLTAANTYVGGTSIANGSTLQLGNGTTAGSIVGDVTDNGTLAFNRSDTSTLSGVISGSGVVNQIGTGTTVLSGTNSYTGGTTVSDGTLSVAADANLGAAAGALTLDGGTLEASASFATARAVTIGTGNGTLQTDAGVTLTTSGVIAGATGGLTKTGAGTLVTTAANTYGGGTTIGAGTLQLGDGTTAGSIVGDVTDNGTLAFNNPGTTTFAGVISGTGAVAQMTGTTVLTAANTYAGGTTISGGTLQLGDGTTAGSIVGDVTDNGTLAFNNPGSTTFAGVISGSGTVLQSGGTTVLSGTNTYAGGTTVSGGTLSVGADANLGAAAGGVTLDGGTLEASASFSTARAVTIGTGNGTLQTDAGVTLTTSGVIAGATGGLTKTGAGTLVTTADNTYGGGTTISAGTLQIGAGGTSGSIVGDIANNATLAFDRSDTFTFAGVISGSGAVNQIGTGTTVLTGSHTYTGDTAITAGTLQVDGTAGSAASTLTVAANATLAGSGTVGGNVTVAGGGIVGPGSASGTAPGTLTIGGNLTLAGTSVLNYQLGQAGVAGGALNDLIDVGGDLTLGGTLNVSESAGGSFGVGLYRIINYAGSLTDNGLVLGSVPAAGSFIQTSVLHQVNLVNTAGLTLNYWDGTGPKFNGVVNGGDGIWQAAAGNDNWTDSTGVVNAGYADGGFAIFAGAPGTVTVDTTLGVINSSGMQFATEGYRVEGGAITLGAGSNVIRVGDGSPEGAGYTATIASVLTGAGGVDKTDSGTLVLTGANTYGGGTTISAGTLQLGDGTTAGSIVGDVTDNGTLAFNNPGSITFAGVISGTGAVAQMAGTTVLTAANTYAGGTSIAAAGTLQLGNGTTAGSITGDVTDNGTLAFNNPGTSTFAGVISGTGAVDQLGGTTVLSSTNTYAGGTTVSGGTLSVGADANLGASAGGVTLDGGTLEASASFATARAVTIGTGNGTLQTDAGATLTASGVISGATGGLAKTGAGTLVTTAANTYGGGTTIGAGTLQLGDGTTAGSITGNVTDNGTLAFNNPGSTTFAGVISGTGAVAQMAGTTVLTAANTYTGGTTIASGTLRVGNGGTTGSIVGNVSNNGTLAFDRSDALDFAGTITGSGVLNQAGTGTTTLRGTGSSAGSVDVEAGTLNLAQSGAFTTTGNYGTATGATTQITADASLAVGGVFTQSTGSTLNVAIGSSTLPIISADTASLGGAINVTGFTATAPSSASALTSTAFTVIHTAAAGGITGDFSPVSLGGATSPVDYLTLSGGVSANAQDYNVGFALTWLAGTTAGNGVFTLANAGDVFDADVALANQSPSSAPWDGQTLTKNGAGTLVLSEANTYTGSTLVNAGTLRTGAADAFADSGAVTVAAGATLDLNGFNQTANNLSGAGSVTLGSAALTVNDSAATSFDGVISGSGSLVKTGAATLTLAGANSYTGGTTIAAGTLQIGNGGTTGSIAGDVLDNATLAFNRSDELVFAGAISGSGAVEQVGSGSTVLTGNSSYTGGTTIAAGTLQIGNGGSTGSITGDVVDNGTLAFNRSDELVFGGAISGSGALVQAGAGTTTLTGANSYTGGTTITTGTLQLGDGTTAGSIVGNVVDNATLAFDNPGTNTFAGVISGTGTVEQLGGTTVLTAANTYGGGTTIAAASTLQLGNGTTAGSIVGDVADNGTLAFNNPGTTTFAGVVSGSGALTQAGGTTVLSAANTYTGGTTIASGTLQVGDGGTTGSIVGNVVDNGTLAFNRSDALDFAGTITGSGVLSQAGTGTTTLRGTGSSVGSANVEAGTLNLAQAGAFTTTGDYTTAAGATTRIAPDSALAVGGVFTQSAGSTLNVAVGSAEPVITATSANLGGALGITGFTPTAPTSASALTSTAFTVIHTAAANGITGDFSSVSMGGATSPVDYLTLSGRVSANAQDYELGFALTWLAGTTAGNGVFTLAGATDVFNVDVALANQASSSVPWDGQTLTKNGAGTLILSEANTYTGSTLVNAGTLRTGAADAFADSGAVRVAAGATLDLNGFNQTANNLSGAGSITLGSAALTVNDSAATSFDGVISGSGSLVKTGAATLTLAGANSYTGGTIIGAGTLQIGNGGTSGSIVGDVADNATLAFNRSDELVFAGVISGSGAVEQLGSGSTVLTGNSSYTGGTTIAAGTLQIGNGGSTGSITGDVVDNATLAFNRSDELVFGGAISGSGALVQAGAGTTTLTGASTYTGGTTITTGILQVGNGGTSGSITGDVIDNNVLAFNRSDAVVFNGAISGSGSLEQRGSGSTTLVGVNGYTGGTTISAGTLQLGDGVSAGSIVGDVNDNGALVFDSPGSTTFAGAISGSGSVSQLLGSTVLTAASSYTGGTAIAAGGTLQLGNGGSSGSIVGNVANNGTLAFNRADAASFDGVISGSGTVNQIGSGSTLLTADSGAFSGSTNVTAGTLQVNGALGNSASSLSVATGGTLAGTGTIGGNVSVADGNVAPGNNSIGTLAIAGNLTLSAASNLNFDFGGSAATGAVRNDLLNVGGDLALAGTLNVQADSADVFGPGLYRVINYAGDLSYGGFAIGTAPPGLTLQVVSGVPHQVNLANSTGLNMNYWDGNGPHFNGVIDGGDGVWQAVSGNQNWVDGTGYVNSGYAGNSFPVFAGAAGTVTVDSSLGAVAATGMQFATSGYRIQGDSIELLPGVDTIRVGDGTADSAHFVATVGSAMTGAGAVVKTDLGTLVLTGANTYTGGTTIAQGTLQIGDGGSTGSIVGDVANDATLVLNRAGTLQLDGTIHGTGGVQQVGSGTAILTGNSSYTGGTTIAAGTLQLGNGGASGLVYGNITNNGTLALNRSDDFSLVGVVSGSGSLSQIGTGASTLVGVNTYTGGTTVSAGTLIGSATSFGSGAIVDDAALVLDQPVDASFANPISGTGTLTKTGAGALNLTGVSTLTGATTVGTGLLSVNGSLANSAVTVQNGGTLGGRGTVGATTIAAGGTVAPGNSIGTLNVNGNFVQAAGSTYLAQVDPAGTDSDRIQVSGSATLQGGSVLDIQKIAPGAYSLNSRYTVLSADGGVSGRYVLTGDLQGAFFKLTDSYDANNVYVTPDQVRSFVDAAGTPNERATAGGLQSLPDGNLLKDAVGLLATDAEARNAFNQLSGELHASAKSQMIEDSHFVRDAANDRTRQALCGVGGVDSRFSTQSASDAQLAEPGSSLNIPDSACNPAHPVSWARAFGSWGSIDADGNAAKMSSNIGGVFAGTDARVFDDWRMGVLAGYSRSSFSVGDRNASGTSDNYDLGVYGGKQWGELGLRLGATYTWHNLDTQRTVAFSGFGDRPNAHYDAGTTQAFGELGWRIDAGKTQLEPFAGLAYVRQSTSAINESGGAAALSAGSESTVTTFTTLGLRASSTFSLGGTDWTARGMVGWRHAFGDVVPSSTLSFNGSNAFTVAGVPIAKDAAVLELGVDVPIAKNAVVGVSYAGQMGGGVRDNGIRATLNWKF